MVVYRRQLLEPNTYVMHLCNNSAFDGDSSASYLAIDYKYKGNMKKRSAIINRILTTDIHLQQLHAENRAGLDVPDATDITISKRKWETACLRFRKHLRDLYTLQETVGSRSRQSRFVGPRMWRMVSKARVRRAASAGRVRSVR